MYRNILTILVLLFLSMGKVWSQASVTSEVFAEVIEALTANENEQLNFGRFSPESTGGQIIINPDGVRTAQGSVILASGSHSPGRFSVSGAPGASFTIQLPDGPATLVHQLTGRTMQVTNWVSDPPVGSEAATLPDGSLLVSIGATLSVGPLDENPVGIYAGTFQLTFAYN